ncbi:DUF3558 family protein [Actinokineospora sp.]|uniref:DUF3558 family protein n=1 Tax=Actinokineospora sp. TaxID=1872133 RepID=UPI003D6AE70E
MKTRFVSTIAISCLISAGCGTSEPVEPTPAPQTSVPRPTSPPSVPAGADARSYLSHVCDLLSPDERARFNVRGEPEQWTGHELSQCIWRGEEVELRFSLSATRDPLVTSYQHAPMMQVWEPRTVEGQPAAITSTHLPRSTCELSVGTAPNQGISLSYNGKDTDVDWCGQALEMGEIIVRRLRDAPPSSRAPTA